LFGKIRDFFAVNFEKEKDNLVLWLPILLAAGIFTRFTTGKHSITLLVIFFIVCIFYRKYKLGKYLILCCLFFVLGYVRTDIFLSKPKTHVIENYVGKVKIFGKIDREKIILMENGEYRKELVVKTDKIMRLETGEELAKIPKKTLIRLENFDTKIYLSSAIIEASIFPVKDKKFSSDFDYKKYLYYQEIGAVAHKGIVLKNDVQEELTLRQKIDIFRYNFAQRIIQTRNSKSATVIATLLTGQKNLVDKDAMNSMNYSGLSHLLSISGLHMMVLITSVFYIVKWLLLRWEWISIHYNVNIIAVFISIFFNFLYLLLSGFSIPAIRAYVICLILLISMLIGRFNDAKRSLFFTLFLMVLINPNAIFQVSFQLSFLSVASIISAIKYYYVYIKEGNSLLGNSKVGKILDFFLLNIVISVVAELANTPITIYNFNNYTFYNVFTNVMAGPLVSFIILPFSMISLVLYFVGLESLLVIPASYATDAVLLVSDYVLSIEDAIIFLPSPSYGAMFFMIFGIIFFSVFESNLKHLGILFYFVGIFIFCVQREPDVFIDKVDRTIYFVNEKKELFVYNPNIHNIENATKKIGVNKYIDITKVYKGEKYLTFYKNNRRVRINLKNFLPEITGGESKIKNNNGFLSLYL
jgi:competence protein ComEC